MPMKVKRRTIATTAVDFPANMGPTYSSRDIVYYGVEKMGQFFTSDSIVKRLRNRTPLSALRARRMILHPGLNRLVVKTVETRCDRSRNRGNRLHGDCALVSVFSGVLRNYPCDPFRERFYGRHRHRSNLCFCWDWRSCPQDHVQ